MAALRDLPGDVLPRISSQEFKILLDLFTFTFSNFSRRSYPEPLKYRDIFPEASRVKCLGQGHMTHIILHLTSNLLINSPNP